MVNRLLGKKVIGVKQSLRSMENGFGETLYVANDADNKLIAPLIKYADEINISIKRVETMKELGKMCGLQIETAAALKLKENNI
ncbi:MAG: ribosomal L7Ae/L30e/S12e/Gadd45 family protein [Oscillospiraceae bacterium]|nr:ribosomal L7Ae/L30e/S12e/Gadd45 family protein [Oscillospiraceae bacterium]